MFYSSGLFNFAENDGLYKAAVIIGISALAALIAASVVVFLILRKKRPLAFTTRDLTFGAVCLAMAFALSFFGYKLPQGGTITPASALPIMIYCYYFGFRKGIVVATAYMFLQFLQDPYIVHPMSAVLDYVIPYMALVLLSVFPARPASAQELSGEYNFKSNMKYFWRNHSRFLLGAACYVLIRYISHVLSGVIFYAEWAWDGWGPLAYSLAYNSFVLIDTVIALIGGVLLLSSKSLTRFMAVSANVLQNADAGQKNN